MVEKKYLSIHVNQTSCKKSFLHIVLYTHSWAKQRPPIFKILSFPIAAQFSKHCMLSGRNQRRALSSYQSEPMKIAPPQTTSAGVEITAFVFTNTRCAAASRHI